jgi:colanic acid biosynthesis protein WcaH
LEERVQKVAVKEIGVTVKFKARPITFNQLFCAHDTRGHFIAFLYECSLGGSFIPNNSGRSEKDRGFLKWHEDCPTNLIKAHEIYRQYMLKNKNENK